MKRVGLFVDVCNLYYSIKSYIGPNARADFNLLKDIAEGEDGDKITKAIAYCNDVPNQQVFLAFLQGLGYEVKVKESHLVNSKPRLDWSVGITLDIVRSLDRLDLVVLCSSNREYAPVLDYCRERGVETLVVGANISEKLKRASVWMELDETTTTNTADCLDLLPDRGGHVPGSAG